MPGGLAVAGQELPGGADEAVPDRPGAQHLDVAAEAGQPAGGGRLVLERQCDHPPAVRAGRWCRRQHGVGRGAEHLGKGGQAGIGLAFLATVRPDGGPRVHPVCAVLSPAGLHLSVIAGPKRDDLRRDGRYALHTETCPPPRQDDGFALTGRATEITDPETVRVVRGQVLSERGGQAWPGFGEEAIFELSIKTCLLMLTRAQGEFPAGPTIWKAG